MVKRSTINTTDSVGERPASEPTKAVKQTDEQRMYADYIRGKNIQSIAAEYGTDAQSVVETIQSIESKR